MNADDEKRNEIRADAATVLPQELPVQKRSVSKLYRCPRCFKQFRPPSRTAVTILRRCKCEPRLTFRFGPERGDGEFLSNTVHKKTTTTT